MIPPPSLGDTEADVTVAAFVDFERPHCQTYELDSFSEIRSQCGESGRVRYEHHTMSE